MKKLFPAILALLMAAALFACGEGAEQPTAAPDPSVTDSPAEDTFDTTPDETPAPTVFTFSQGTALLGTDLSCMTAQEAADALGEAAGTYSLTLTANGAVLTFSAEDLGLTLDGEALSAWLAAAEAGETPEDAALVSFACDGVKTAVEEALNKSAVNARVRYDASAGQFVVKKESSGVKADTSGLLSAVESAVAGLERELTVDLPTTDLAPGVCASDGRFSALLDQANRYLTLQLTYTYEAPGVSASVKVTKADLASFLKISDKSFAVSIDGDGIAAYVKTMKNKYSGAVTTGAFQGTMSGAVDLTVDYYGAVLDSTAMAADIRSCLENMTSGTRAAPYVDQAASEGMAFGGSYVEVDLTNQMLWCYKNGTCVVATPIVSGYVQYTGNRTPTGVFSIRSKSADVYLRGSTWYDFVHYWMPFYGAYGLHDAMWRDEFGGQIYRYDGSHGCVNIPVEAAGLVYNNVSVGTKVIVHGGVNTTILGTQVLTGTQIYQVNTDAQPFFLDVEREYIGTEMTYASDNTSVVTVSEDGEVTVVGPGKATITVTSAALNGISGAAMTVEVEVTQVCQGEHTVSQWETVTEATCTAGGLERGVCDLCHREVERETPPLGHDFTAGEILCGRGCGVENPDYREPEPSTGSGEMEDPEPDATRDTDEEE